MTTRFSISLTAVVGALVLMQFGACSTLRGPTSASATDAPNGTFCSHLHARACTQTSECSSGEYCTRDWNREIVYQAPNVGHCLRTDGTASASDALQADFCALPDPVRPESLGVPYNLPPNASLLLDDTGAGDVGAPDGVAVHIDRRVILNGNGSVLLLANAPPNTTFTALKLEGAYSQNHHQNVAASRSTIRDLSISPQNTAQNANIGIDIKVAGVRLNNLRIQKIGTAIQAHGGVDHDSAYANVNSQQWSHLSIFDCYVAAISTDGTDAQGGLIEGVEIVGGEGIHESSFLGNVYVAALIENAAPATQSFRIDGAANSSTVIGAYVENSAPTPKADGLNTLFVGGNIIPRLDSPGDRVGSQWTQLRFQRKYGDRNIREAIPGNDASVIQWQLNPTETSEWKLRYEDSSHAWGFTHGRDVVYGFTGEQSPLGAAHPIPAPVVNPNAVPSTGRPGVPPTAPAATPTPATTPVQATTAQPTPSTTMSSHQQNNPAAHPAPSRALTDPFAH